MYECQSVNGTGHFPGQGRGMHALLGCTLFEGGCTL
jgi:hypothetical protein